MALFYFQQDLLFLSVLCVHEALQNGQSIQLYFGINNKISNNKAYMIDDDIKFFRQNFSASSLSDFTQTPKKHPLYESKNNRLNVPHPKRYSREVHYHREEQRSLLKSEIPKPETRNSKTLQYKMLTKLKSQHEEIRHFNANSQQQSIRMEQSDRASQSEKNRFKAQKSKKKNSEEDKKSKNTRTELFDHEDQKFSSLHKKQSRQLIFQSKTKELEMAIQQKQRQLKKMKSSEQQVIQHYKSQIASLKQQINRLVEENQSLKKDIIMKELENKELKQNLKRKQNDQRCVSLEKQLNTSRSKQMEYLSTIKNFQQREAAAQNLNEPNTEMIAQISRLKLTLQENNQMWEKRLHEAVQSQKKASLQAAQKLLLTSRQVAPNHERRGLNQQNFFQQQLSQQNQFMRSSSLRRFQNIHRYDNYRKGSNPYDQKITRGERAIQMLVQQLQHLRRPYNPVQQELRNIKDSMKALMRKTQLKQFKDLANTTDSLHMVSQLQNLKMYIIKEENARKNYTQQVTFYRNQHQVLLQQNKSLKSQVSTLQESLNLGSKELDELRITVVDQRSRLQQKSKYVEELANSLANIQAHQIDNYTKIKTNIDKQRNSQLQVEVQRLRALLQTEVMQLNKAHDQRVRGLQNQIQNQERKMRDQEDLVKGTTQQLKQYEVQLSLLGQKSAKDIAILRQANQRLQQEGISLRSQVSAFSTNNLSLQVQLKQRSHAIDHLWMVKQAEFDNIMGQLSRMREGLI